VTNEDHKPEFKKVESFISPLLFYQAPSAANSIKKMKRKSPEPVIRSEKYRENLKLLNQLINENNNKQQKKIKIIKPRAKSPELKQLPIDTDEKEKQEKSEKAKEYIRQKKIKELAEKRVHADMKLKNDDRIANELKKIEDHRRMQRLTMANKQSKEIKKAINLIAPDVDKGAVQSQNALDNDLSNANIMYEIQANDHDVYKLKDLNRNEPGLSLVDIERNVMTDTDVNPISTKNEPNNVQEDNLQEPTTTTSEINFEHDNRIARIKKELEACREKIMFQDDSESSISRLSEIKTVSPIPIDYISEHSKNEEVDFQNETALLRNRVGVECFSVFNIQIQQTIREDLAADKIKSFFLRYCNPRKRRISPCNVKIDTKPSPSTTIIKEYDMDDYSPLFTVPFRSDSLNIFSIFARKHECETTIKDINEDIPEDLPPCQSSKIEPGSNNSIPRQPCIVEAEYLPNIQDEKLFQQPDPPSDQIFVAPEGPDDPVEAEIMPKILDLEDDRPTEHTHMEEIILDYLDDFSSSSAVESEIKEDISFSDISIDTPIPCFEPESSHVAMNLDDSDYNQKIEVQKPFEILDTLNNIKIKQEVPMIGHKEYIPRINVVIPTTINTFMDEKTRLMGKDGRKLSPKSLSRK
jgi:hypothetical protein